MNKNVACKFYNSSGQYLGYSEDVITGSFSSAINGGAGSCTIDFPYRFDSFDSYVSLNNRVDIYVYDDQAPGGTKIYSGFIFDITANVGGTTEKVSVNLAGFIALLERDVFKNSSGNYIVTISPQEIAATYKYIIDTFRYNNPTATINYASNSVQNTGKSRGITFNNSTYLDDIKSITKLLDPNWFWYLDNSNTFYLSQFSAVAKHLFYFGKDIVAINDTQSLSTLQNEVLFWNGLASSDPNYIAKKYSNTTSIAKYGRASQLVNDSRFTQTSSADDYGSRTLGLLSNPTRQVTIDVIDGSYGMGYDIESINPGDTFKIMNSEVQYNLMVVTSITYNYTSVSITADDYRAYIERTALALSKNLKASQYTQNAPITYA